MKRRENKFELFFLFLILLIASFLRLYRLKDFQFFTYDQARDALIIKRIIIDKKITLVGPTVLIPGVFLPPFYYYLMAPILVLGRLDPLVLDYFTALLGIGFVGFIWYAVNRFFGRPAGIFSAFFLAVSPIMVDLSRRAWNPNLIPFLSLIFVFLVYLFIQSKNPRYLIFSLGILGLALSFHLSIICLFPLLLWAIILKVKRVGLRQFFFALVLFLALVSPLLLFDFRHNFVLAKNIIAFFGKTKGDNFNLTRLTNGFLRLPGMLFLSLPFGFFQKKLIISYFVVNLFKKSDLIYAPVSIVSHSPQFIYYPFWGIISFWLTIFLFLKKIRKYQQIFQLLLVWLFSGLVVSLFYPADFHFYFLDFAFPLPFIFLGFIFKELWQTKGKLVILSILTFIGIVNGYLSLAQEPADPTVKTVISVSRIIAEDVGDELFNLAVSHRYSDRWDRNAVEYRYFVESYFKKFPLDDSPLGYTQAEYLYFIDEGGGQEVLNAKIMEVQAFSPKKIINNWEIEGLKIYKLSK